jgi:nucleotide-binding universal stress UspA family protein
MVKNQRFVVGVDGSAAGRAALRWAVAQAADHDGGSIHVVAAWRREAPSPGASKAASPKDRLTEMLAAEVAAIGVDGHAGTEISTAVVEGSPADVLAEASRDADMLVLGKHGHGKAWHMLVGWTSEECARRVDCPVVIVSPPAKAKATAKAKAKAA